MSQIEYLLEVGDHKEEDLLAAFEKISNKPKEAMLTRGRQEEKLGIARTMFHAGEPIERPVRWTGLSQAHSQLIKHLIAVYSRKPNPHSYINNSERDGKNIVDTVGS